MTVLVTGAAGFLGRALCGALLRRGHAVRAVARTRPAGDDVAGLDWRLLDLADAPDWSNLLRGVDTVYHLAWSTTPASAAAMPAQDLAVNVGGLIGLLEAARGHADLRIVFPSSGGTVYGRVERLPIAESAAARPLSVYGAAKLTAETYLDLYRTSHGVNSIALRISNLLGAGQDPRKGQGVVTHFARAAMANEPLTLFGDGQVVRDFIHIDDVVAAMILAGERSDVQGPLNIGAGVGHSLNDVIAAIEGYFGRPMNVQRLPSRAFDVPASVLDVSLARQRLGWAPTISFADGLTHLLDDMSAG